MFRFVLAAYLSITVVFGPVLCCCSAQVLFPWGNEAGCCGSPQAKIASHHAHSHHHHAHHEHPEVARQAAQPQQAPCDHNRKDCPCGENKPTLFASQTCNGAAVMTVGPQVHGLWTFMDDCSLLNGAGTSLNAVLFGVQAKPGHSGREILRAHHRLQC